MSNFNLKTIKALLKKEFIEHKVAFFNVPAIIISIVTITIIFGILVNGNEWRVKTKYISNMDISGFDLFNTIYAFSIMGWLVFLLLMLFFYFASSFSADRKDNALLFWKSLPISDLQIMSVKTLAGLIVFPLTIMLWSLVAALFTFIIFLVLGAFLPVMSDIGSQTNFVTLLNIQGSALVFIAITLLWYLPLFGAVGLLGTFVRGWAVPAFILLLLLGKILESIFTLSNGGYFSDLMSERFGAPFEAISNVFSSPNFSTNVDAGGFSFIGNFVPAYIAQINWIGMVSGWLVAAIFIFIASEYRRRRIQA